MRRNSFSERLLFTYTATSYEAAIYDVKRTYSTFIRGWGGGGGDGGRCERHFGDTIPSCGDAHEHDEYVVHTSNKNGITSVLYVYHRVYETTSAAKTRSYRYICI